MWVARGLLGLALAGVALLALRRRSEASWLAATVFLASAIAVTPALSGHARVEGTLAILSDSIHVLAAGVWVGGLAFLALLLVKAGGDRWSLAMKVVPRFSTLAVASVIALVVGRGGERLPRSGLVERARGRRRTGGSCWPRSRCYCHCSPSVPTTTGSRCPGYGPATPASAHAPPLRPLVAARAGADGRGRRCHHRPRGGAAGEGAGGRASGVVSRDGEIGPYRFTLTVDPARTGSNEIHVYLLDSTGALAPVDEIACLPPRFPRSTSARSGSRRRRPGQATESSPPPSCRSPATGELQLDVRKGEFDQWSTTIDIPIRKDS